MGYHHRWSKSTCWPLRRFVWPLYWLAQGTMFWALFVVGHDWCAPGLTSACIQNHFSTQSVAIAGMLGAADSADPTSMDTLPCISTLLLRTTL